jgi:hypothetical protein
VFVAAFRAPLNKQHQQTGSNNANENDLGGTSRAG